MNIHAVLSVGLLAGTIIGAGVFSLPYLFWGTGFVPGIFYLLFFVFIYIIFYFMYSALLLQEKEQHDFFKLSEKYFSPHISKISSLIIIVELLLALVAYLVLTGMFFEFGFGIQGLIPTILFWVFGSLFLFFKLKWLGIAELLGTISIIGIVIFIFFVSGDTFNMGDVPLFSQTFNLDVFLLPFGPLLFSFSGRPAISKVVEEHRKANEKKTPFSIKKTLVLGTIIPALVYIIFVLGVLKIGGPITPDALSGLISLTSIEKALLGILGLITLWTSYVMIAINVKDIIVFDARRSRLLGFIIPLFFPICAYFLGLKDFLFVIGLAGGVFIACEGIFVTCMWQKAFPKHPLHTAGGFLYVVFGIAIVYEVAHFILGF
jgi:tryptophan-specific transport protein